VSPMVHEAFRVADELLFGGANGTLLKYSMVSIALLYGLAALINLWVPNTGVDHKPPHVNPVYLVRDFAHCVRLLWQDKLGQITLAVTTLFWGAGATLQFIMLRWAEHTLGLRLDQATYLQAVFAVGVALGAVLAGKLVPIDKSVKVVSVGIAMGLLANLMVVVSDQVQATVLMVLVGAMAGFFVVPMNALLQHRGHILMGAGHSIAVQNFNENLSILVMLALYAVLVWADLSINTVIILFSLFVALTMYLVRRWHQRNMREHPAELERLLAVAANLHHAPPSAQAPTVAADLKKVLPEPKEVLAKVKDIAVIPVKRRRRRRKRR